jgi:hypothetical protein
VLLRDKLYMKLWPFKSWEHNLLEPLAGCPQSSWAVLIWTREWTTSRLNVILYHQMLCLSNSTITAKLFIRKS